jgi:hypothetical protein
VMSRDVDEDFQIASSAVRQTLTKPGHPHLPVSYFNLARTIKAAPGRLVADQAVRKSGHCKPGRDA